MSTTYISLTLLAGSVLTYWLGQKLGKWICSRFKVLNGNLVRIIAMTSVFIFILVFAEYSREILHYFRAKACKEEHNGTFSKGICIWDGMPSSS